MTFLESSALLTDISFGNRVRISLSKYMNELILVPESKPEGQRISNAFDSEVQKTLNALVGNEAVLAAASGSSVDDATLAQLVKDIVITLSPSNQTVPTGFLSGGYMPQHYPYSAAQPLPQTPPAPKDGGKEK
jgi:hypothetical protein